MAQNTEVVSESLVSTHVCE